MIEAEETKEYREFVDKFKPKKTTDDCYTPEYSQKEKRKGIFGGGFLLSEKAAAEKAAAEKAAAERAAAEKWSLSEREKKIIENLK